MDHASKQTALFFGFLTAAMTAASAQAAPIGPVQTQAATAAHRSVSAADVPARLDALRPSQIAKRAARDG